ncbi:hypothetical protein AC579_3501 [Pseudocercospora musae]|uniref:Uncharacterized protein n=1 Tax=Pseudocercospora musae TaxID=113226 RepID=A0A139I3B7_9PEZI|nr:hypothetical protein AC579_3501 [Pseudocercospora musae]KXT09223.1 hypothetical protein AC579_3501 [Pseudocercospora musae]
MIDEAHSHVNTLRQQIEHSAVICLTHLSKDLEHLDPELQRLAIAVRLLALCCFQHFKEQICESIDHPSLEFCLSCRILRNNSKRRLECSSLEHFEKRHDLSDRLCFVEHEQDKLLLHSPPEHLNAFALQRSSVAQVLQKFQHSLDVDLIGLFVECFAIQASCKLSIGPGAISWNCNQLDRLYA